MGDLRQHLRQNKNNYTVCDVLDLVPGGISNIFQSQQLSSTRSGFVEPLLPPFRHLDFCHNRSKDMLFDMRYLVHDFATMCRQLTPTSRIILFDMGASLEYHTSLEDEMQVSDMAHNPPIYLTTIYQKMGFHFDHIYAYEKSFSKPETVFELVPDDIQSAYHWINIGVSSDKGAKDNPLTMLSRDFHEDDLIIVKLDIDTAFIELPLVKQILEDERFGNLIDQFYFEHHIHTKEMARIWRSAMSGTVKQSLELFSGLRQKGIAAHYWP